MEHGLQKLAPTHHCTTKKARESRFPSPAVSIRMFGTLRSLLVLTTVLGIKNWIDAGVPANKINAGLAYYGRAMQTVDNMQDTQYAASIKGAPKGDSDDAYWQDPSCHLDEGGFSGIWKWTNLRSQGIINQDGSAAGDYTKHWDDISKTPWLFNEKTKMFISYDDEASLQHKIDLALCLDIGGVMTW